MSSDPGEVWARDDELPTLEEERDVIAMMLQRASIILDRLAGTTDLEVIFATQEQAREFMAFAFAIVKRDRAKR